MSGPKMIRHKVNIQQRRGAGSRKTYCGLRSKIYFLIVILSLVTIPLMLLSLLWVPKEYVHTASSVDNSPRVREATKTKVERFPPVYCPTQIKSRNKTEANDPNMYMAESPKRLTITDPSFWISLHKEYFDKMRWIHIMGNGNYYETGVTDQFHQILGNTTMPGLVLDIGMNIGWFTLWARAHGHSVAAFEPNLIMHTRVCESLELNNWQKDGSVKIFPYGLGKEEATLNLTTGNNPGGSSFYEDRLAKKYRKHIPVRVVTLDSVAEQEGWINVDAAPIHLMKVDVEGYEPLVFEGGMKLIQSGKVENIIMENSVTDAQEVIGFFATIYQAGYKVKLVSTVNGDPYHPEMLPQINKELSEIYIGMNLESLGEGMKFLVKVNCNLWWEKS